MRDIDWMSSERRFPGKLRPPGAPCIIRVEACIQHGTAAHTETRSCISSANLDAKRAGQAVHGHWAIKDDLHRVLDVSFGDDQSWLRRGFGTRNVAVVCHFAFSMVRAGKDKHAIRLQQKLVTWTRQYLEHLLNAAAHQNGFVALMPYREHAAPPSTQKVAQCGWFSATERAASARVAPSSNCGS